MVLPAARTISLADSIVANQLVCQCNAVEFDLALVDASKTATPTNEVSIRAAKSARALLGPVRIAIPVCCLEGDLLVFVGGFRCVVLRE